MAELALKVGGNGSYEDGDVVDAFNRRRIRAVHAGIICHVKHAGFDRHGLRPADSLARMFMERTRQYRFERRSWNTLARVTVATGKEEILSDEPNAKGEYIHVEEYVDSRLEHPRHAVFGEPGREVWYGGRTALTHEVLDGVWAEIEGRTALREVDHALFPVGTDDLKVHFFISVDDFDDAALEELKSSITRDTGEINKNGQPIFEVVKKRRHYVDWKVGLGVSAKTQGEILDRTKAVDGRASASYLREAVVLVKQEVQWP